VKKENRVEIYRVAQGEVIFDIDAKQETIWATQAQMAQLFDVDRTVIGRHLRNIYKEGELDEKRTSAKNARVEKEGGRVVTRQVKSYNLDAIISVGYRVNSKKATGFRIWATKVLKNYVVNGAAVNERRLKELPAEKLNSLETTLGVVKRLMLGNELTADEANGVLEVIARYADSFKTLEEYDAGHISFRDKRKARKELTVEKCQQVIDKLREQVGGSELFGKVRGDAFNGSLEAIYQSFDARELYPTVAEKAANLLYFIIKDHPFYDGNKRIGALLFIVFLTMNDYSLSGKGEVKISDRALVALALLIAESEPEEKDLIVALVCRMLEE